MSDIPPDRPPYCAPPPPADEAERLSQLRALNILDTEAEERFDRLTRLARRLFDVPIALVSLVDESRQWFKSKDGLDACETPRDVSFCGHAILEPGTFVIPDATKDERFAQNPLVLGEPYVRFYAGHPLRTADGQALGTLCLIDHEVRNLDERDFASLKDLAAMAEQELAAMQLATLDELTGISNRRGFTILADKILNVDTRLFSPAVIAYFDLDDFKLINDSFGHAEGDAVLVGFANCMKQVFRDSDVFARLGGDEFVALFSNTSLPTAGRVIERFNGAISELNGSLDGGYEVGFSHGLVEYDPKVHRNVAEFLDAADRRMYEHKRERRHADAGETATTV